MKAKFLLILAAAALTLPILGCYSPPGEAQPRTESWRQPVKPSAWREESRGKDFSGSRGWGRPKDWNRVPRNQDYSEPASKPRLRDWRTNRRSGARSQNSATRQADADRHPGLYESYQKVKPVVSIARKIL